MNELQRMQYLDALGVDTYMPRMHLVLAPNSIACAPVIAESADETPVAEIPVAADVTGTDFEVVQRGGEHPASTAPQPSSKNAEAPAQVLEVLDQFRGKAIDSASVAIKSATTVEASAAQGEVAVAESNSAKEMPRFALTFWRIDERLLVVDTRQAELALPVDALLLNLLRALGVQLTAVPKSEVLRWPMGDDPFSPRDEQSAQDTVRAMVAAMQEHNPVEHIMLMGSSACHYLIDQPATTADQSYSETTGKLLPLSGLGDVTGVVLPSLADILQTPLLKADVWKAIQFLRR